MQLVKMGLKLGTARVRLTRQWRKLERRGDGDEIDRYAALFRNKPQAPSDHVVKRWQTDEEFGWQRLNGLCPWFLQAVDELPGAVANTPGVARAIANGRPLYQTDHAYLAGVPIKAGTWLCAPLCVFTVDERGTLVPLAIQLHADREAAPVFEPADPPGTWLAAKIWANCCDLHVNDTFIHGVTFHFAMEALWIAAQRCLAPAHPIKAFLEPHFTLTLASSATLRMAMAEDGPLTRIHAFTHAGLWDFLRDRYRDWSVSDLDIEKNLARRGILDIPGFHYRDDSLRHWRAICEYVHRLVDAVYGANSEVECDDELQAWVRELAAPACAGLRGLPLEEGGRMERKETLAGLLAAVVFTAATKHSYLQNAGYEMDAFVPNMPAMFHLPPPTTKAEISREAIAQALPPRRLGIEQMAQIESIEYRNRPFNPLGRYRPQYMAGAGAEVVAVVRDWQAALARLEAELEARNRGLGDRPFTHLLPSRCLASIAH